MVIGVPVDRPLETTSRGGDERGNSIELRGVEKRYGPYVALEPIDLDIDHGENGTIAYVTVKGNSAGPFNAELVTISSGTHRMPILIGSQ